MRRWSEGYEDVEDVEEFALDIKRNKSEYQGPVLPRAAEGAFDGRHNFPHGTK